MRVFSVARRHYGAEHEVVWFDRATLLHALTYGVTRLTAPGK